MIHFEDLEDGKKFWYFELEFSNKTYRLTKKRSPIEVIFRAEVMDFVKAPSGSRLGQLYEVDLKTGREYSVRSVYKSYGASNDELCYIYPDEESSVSDWNMMVQDQLDNLQNFYETKMKYLGKIKIKK